MSRKTQHVKALRSNETLDTHNLQPFQDDPPASLELPAAESSVNLTFEPLYGMVQVRLIEESRDYRAGTLFLPQNALKVQKAARYGEVVAVGCGHRLENGEFTPLRVKVGDKVYFAALAGADIRLGNDEFLITREEDILGIVRETPKIVTPQVN